MRYALSVDCTSVLISRYPYQAGNKLCFRQNGVNFLRHLALQGEKSLDDSSRLDVAELLWLAVCIVVVVLYMCCYVYLLYFSFYFRRRTAG